MPLEPEQFHKSVTQERIIELVQQDDNMGLCVACGEEASCVEPDAREYECESCGRSCVYGAEELLVMVWNYRLR